MRCDRGATLIEAAISLPVVLFSIFAIIAFAMILNVQITLNGAARAAVRHYAINEIEQDAIEEAERELVAGGLFPERCAITFGKDSDRVSVDIEYHYVSPLPGLNRLLGGAGGQDSFILRSYSVYNKESLDGKEVDLDAAT